MTVSSFIASLFTLVGSCILGVLALLWLGIKLSHKWRCKCDLTKDKP